MSKNPSVNNGFFKIANEMSEIFAKTSLSGSEIRILWVVMRKTWGWVNGNKRKDFDKISLSQFTLSTQMKQANVVRSLKMLIEKNIILKTNRGYGINQDYSLWIVEKRLQRLPSSLQASSLQASSQKEVNSSLLTTKSSSLLTTYKRKKETNTKEIGNTPSKNARTFFTGISNLMERVESEEATNTKLFLQSLEAKYTGVEKGLIWNEIKKFYLYWTEKNATGTKERWQKQDVFEVDRRLVTWFGKINEFKRSEINSKDTKVGKI